MGRFVAAMLVIAVSLDLDISEFVTLQRLSAGELQQRFGLPVSCDPSLSAMRRPHEKIAVQITCSEGRRSGRPPSPSGGGR